MSERITGWLDLSVQADAESVEAVSELLSRYGHNGGVVIEEPYRQDEDGDRFEVLTDRPVVVRTYLPDDDRAAGVQRKIAEGLWHLSQIGSVGPVEVVRIQEEDWANSWKEHFQVLRIGRRWVVKPTWRDYEPEPRDRVIELDPGMAFGTGSHPSTELCLLMMEEIDLADKRVLDVGAGSGILSIAAAVAGAREVDAVEIDGYAYKALRSNISLNVLNETVDSAHGRVEYVLPNKRRFDIVLANMISSILIENVEPITDRIVPGGVLVLSGIIVDHEDEVRAAFAERDLELHGRLQAGDWVALRLMRIPDAR